jgi:uncharacterized protein (TIGR03086 family)
MVENILRDIWYACAYDKLMHTNNLRRTANLIEFDRRTVRRSVELADRADPVDLARATPCAGWTLADLLAHMTAQHYGFAAAATGRGADPANWAVPPSGPDIVARYRAAAGEVVDAFAGLVGRDQEFALPELSPRPFQAERAIGFHFIDYVVHSWDVARSLGTGPEFPADLLEAAMPIARAVPDGGLRLAPGASFAPALPAAGGRDLMDEIVALLGRSPSCSPPA